MNTKFYLYIIFVFKDVCGSLEHQSAQC